jgi:hypothetical protein
MAKKLKDTLTCVLTHHWFDRILSGSKRVEYRDMGTHWSKRLTPAKQKALKWVVFQRGYTKVGEIKFRIDKIDTGKCPYPGWDDKYYRIHFSKGSKI